MSDTGKKIAVLGAGTSGVGAARLAKSRGASVCVYDSGDAEKLAPRAELLTREGIDYRFGSDAVAPGALDITVISPGIDAETEFARTFTAVSDTLIGEIEFAFQRSEIPVIAITGTNGKTTTTELIETVLNVGGQPTVAAGNYGESYSEVVLSGKDYAVITLEMSSFQLETIDTFRPIVSVWMNFAPDHMDRYKSVEDYREAKLEIFKNQAGDDAAVYNADEAPEGMPERRLGFSGFTDAGDFSLVDGMIEFHGDPVFNYATAKLEGRHNAENVMAALAVAHLRGIEFSTITDALTSYSAPAHRCEFVGESSRGVRFINDSKATNLHALRSSLRGQESPVILIAGGKNKGLDYAEVAGAVEASVTHVILIGEIAEKIAGVWAELVDCDIADSIEVAVAHAAEIAAPGQTVLFSPGTSSFDMFTSYGERGDAFRRAVEAL